MSLIKQKETEYWDMINIRQQLVNQLTAMGVTASTSETVTSLINKVSSISLISTTINLSLSTSSIHYGGSVTATITLDDTSANALSNREVILYNGTTEVGRATTSDTGSATITFKADTVGSNSYTAKFLGKAQYKYSTSTAQTLTVAKADTVITLTASPTTVTSGSSTTLTVTLKDEWGNDLNGETVKILNGSTELYSGITANTGIITTNQSFTSTATLSAQYSGNLENTYNASSKSITVTVETALYNPSLSGSESITTIGSNRSPIISSNMLCGGCGYLTAGWSNSTNWKLTLDFKFNICNGICIIDNTTTSRDTKVLKYIKEGFYIYTGPTVNLSIPTLDTWHTLTITKTGSTTLTYEVNGNTGTLTWDSLSSINNLSIGTDYWDSNSYSGTTYIKNIKVVKV